jgi:aminoacyl tRNA synthase complex-interacting multifunctional protein 1
MAASPWSGSLADVVKRYLPSLEETTPASHTELDAVHLSQTVYPSIHYTDAEKVEISQWVTTANRIAAPDEGEAKQAERLGSLNTHLSTRTTILGSKPSIADVAMLAHLSPLVRKWSPEERTGEEGYHHIVRYVDFVQNAPLLGLSVKEGDKVPIDPGDVRHVHRPVDSKVERERKRKEKEKTQATGDSNHTDKPLVVRQKDADTAAQGPKQKDDATEQSTPQNPAEDGARSAANGPPPTDPQPKQDPKPKRDKPAKATKPAPASTPLSPSLIDLRVGHILKAVNHPNADSLYVSTIACGDPAGTENTSEHDGRVVRTVCSGLNGLVPLAEMQGRKIVAVCNLKPVTMRGVRSAAMVLAASPRAAPGEADSHAGPVELVEPPEGAPAGERVWFEGWEGEPEGMLNPKKKVWDQCQAGFNTTEALEVAFEPDRVEALRGEVEKGRPAAGRLVTKSGGVCKVRSLKGATVR